jgi:tetratricopeptide (TPR) repeat protein
MNSLKRDSSNPLINAGDLYFNNKDYLEAIKCYDMAINSNKKNKDAIMGKGLALREMGRYDDSISCFNEYIEIDKEDTQGLIEKANTCICQNQYVEASECFDKCLKIDRKQSTQPRGEKRNPIFTFFWRLR